MDFLTSVFRFLCFPCPRLVTVLLIGGLALPLSAPAQWTQLGADIDGESAFDESGFSVALSADGARLAVGANRNDGNGSGSGHARVYEWNGVAWTQLGADIDGEAASDNSGYSVALSADGARLAVGAPSNDDNGNSAGHVRVYDWNGASWTQLGADIDGEAASDNSGYSVALSADGARLAVGAPANDDNGNNAGQVRVYDWNGASWTQLGADIDGEAASDNSGYSVALSADGARLAIGAPFNDGGGRDDTGHVRVFEWDGAAWTQLGADVNGEAPLDQSGQSVALSADGARLAIGAPRNDNGGTDPGHVRVYGWDGAAWTQLGSDINGEWNDDRSGWSVSLSADGARLAIGGPYNPAPNPNTGHVRVYDWQGLDWTQVGGDIDGELGYDLSGLSVALSADGARLAVGAPFNDGIGSDAGHVRVHAAPAPVLTLDASVLNFGDVEVACCSASQTVTLDNTGTADLEVTAVTTATAPFARTGGSCAATPFTLAPAAACTMEFTFSPTTMGAASQAIAITNTAAGSPDNVTLQGNGVYVTRRSFTGPLPSGRTGVLSFTTSDPACTFLADPVFLPESAASPPPPGGLELLDGLVAFEISQCAPGATVTMTIDYGVPVPTDMHAWKVADPWRPLDTVVSGNSVRFDLSDGGPNDADGAANGVIVDPSGAGRLSVSPLAAGGAAEPIPADARWSLWLLLLLVAVTGMAFLRRMQMSQAWRARP